MGHKESTAILLVCWCVVIIGALSFAPLELEKHEEYDIQYTWDADEVRILLRHEKE